MGNWKIVNSSLKTHNRFQTKMGTVYVYPFSDQNGTKTIPDGAAHTYIAYLREYPPPPAYVYKGGYRLYMEVLLSAFRLQVYYSITDLRRIFLQSAIKSEI